MSCKFLQRPNDADYGLSFVGKLEWIRGVLASLWTPYYGTGELRSARLAIQAIKAAAAAGLVLAEAPPASRSMRC